MRTEKCMLAQAGDEKQIKKMVESGNWHFERKYDGERCIIEAKKYSVSLFNRRGKEINTQFPELEEMAKSLPLGIYDGEIYVEANKDNKDKPTTAGRTNVNPKDALLLSKIKPATFMCFDVLEYEGRDIRNETYESRKEILTRIDRGLKGFYGVLPEEYPLEVWKEIVANGDEGMIAKEVESKYQHLRAPSWKKLKTWQEADFKVVGITSERREISALVLENGMKVNCALNGAQYNTLLADLVKTDSVMRCNDGTLAVRLKKTYLAKVKFLHQSGTGLRFPILHQLEGF